MFSTPRKNIDALGIRDNMIVADIGTGSGHYAIELAKRAKNGRVYIVDVQSELLERVLNLAHEEGRGNLKAVHSNIETDISITPGTVDLALVSNVLFQCHDRKKAIMNVAKIVKKGGQVVIIDWIDSFGGIGPEASRVLRKSDVREIAESLGLKFVNEFNAGSHHYGLIYIKQ